MKNENNQEKLLGQKKNSDNNLTTGHYLNKLTKANILIVDDTSANVKLLSSLLAEKGYKVRGAISGEMALRAVKQIPPELILLDVKMPNMDGYEVCSRLKQNPASRNIPIIFLSALTDTRDKQKAFELGGQDYITKPFQLAEVLMRVENQLRLQAAQNRIRQLNDELEAKVKNRTAELEQEIKEHKATQANLRKMAFHDSLTGLPNRSLFLELLAHSMERSKRRENYLFAVLFLDCDRFKLVNDSLGHSVGDLVLKELAHRLQSCLRTVDTIARLGGDEFIILLEDLEKTDDAIIVAERLIQEFRTPFYVNQRRLFLGASIGIVLNTKYYQVPEMILRDADTAMYKAKESGKNCYQIFQPEMHRQAQQVLQLETDLRIALESEQFLLHYQPIISLPTNSIKGFEALVRWQHPQRGLLSPLDFIPIAEETGLIIPLGIWVLRQACTQFQMWQRQHSVARDFTINVNLSVQQFAQPDLIEQIDKILAETSINSQCLILEITETAIMRNSDLATDILQQLHNRQIRLSIDDFGTGYSSLSYLHRFRVEQLKIDRSFVNSIERKADNLKIIDTIISLAQHLNMEVVAEGIETEEQLDKVSTLGCAFGQGYFFSKPLAHQLIEPLFPSAS